MFNAKRMNFNEDDDDVKNVVSPMNIKSCIYKFSLA